MLKIESQTNLVSHDKGNGIQRVRFNRFISGMHRGHYGHPGPSDDPGSKLSLGHVWSIIGPKGNTLKGSMNIGDRFGTIGITGEERRANWKSSVLVRRTFGVIWKEFRSTGNCNNMFYLLIK